MAIKELSTIIGGGGGQVEKFRDGKNVHPPLKYTFFQTLSMS